MASLSSMPLEVQSIIIGHYLEELAEKAVSDHGGLTTGQHVYEVRKAIGPLAFASVDMLDACTTELLRLVQLYDDRMEAGEGRAATVSRRKYVYFVQMLCWLECATDMVFDSDEVGVHLRCRCEACIALIIPTVDLTTGKAFTAGGGCPDGRYHLRKWHTLLIVRDLELNDGDDYMEEHNKKKDTKVVKRRRNSV